MKRIIKHIQLNQLQKILKEPKAKYKNKKLSGLKDKNN